METKIFSHRISSLRRSLNFENGFGVDSDGSKGGLALFRKSKWKVDLKSYGPGHIDTLVTDPSNLTWRFTGFYGNPARHHRHLSWELLRRLNAMYSLPWVIGGDFNEIIHLSEKYGGLNTCSSSMINFGKTLNNCALIDIGYEGSPFTWTNNQLFPCTINERLDHFLANINWKSLFRGARAIHLDYYGSDHRMIHIEIPFHICLIPVTILV